MQYIYVYLCVGLIMLTGCGGYAPLHRAHDVLFDAPYITQQRAHGLVTCGVKRLSTPEIHEIFCRPHQLEERYALFYLRIHNAGQKTYFVHIGNTDIPTQEDLAPFFDPSSLVMTVLKIGLLPLSLAVAALSPDTISAVFAFAGINMAVTAVDNYVLGTAGYTKLAGCALVTDPDRGVPGITVKPYHHEHYLLFLPRSEMGTECITLCIGAAHEQVEEIRFDMSTPLLATGVV